MQFFDVVHRLHVLQLYGQFPLLLSFSYYGSILFYLVVKNIFFDDIKLFLIFANRFLQAIISTLLTVEINASLFCSTTLWQFWHVVKVVVWAAMFYRRSQNNAPVNLRKKCIRHYLDFNNSNINDELIFCNCLYIYARVKNLSILVSYF